MDTTGAIAEATQESTETQSTESSGQGPVESQGSQEQKDSNAGDPQGHSEGGKDQGTESRQPYIRKPSKNQTIYELRAAVRERDQKLQSFEERLAQFEQKFQPRQERKPSRTFWEAPEEVLEERLQNHITAMEERLAARWEEQQTKTQQTEAWKQETLEATKLIKDTLKLSFDQEEELAELLRSRPAVRQMSPMERADYAIYLWNKDKGIRDTSAMKHQAATVTGAGVSQGGPKIWTEAQIEAEMKKFPSDPGKWTDDIKKKFDAIDQEIKSAYTQNRVRK
jgi:hypothetical protein